MNGVIEFDFSHVLDNRTVFHAKIEVDKCYVNWLEKGEKKEIIYPAGMANRFLEEKLWIRRV